MQNETIIKVVAEDDKYKPSYANETDYCMDVKVKVPEGLRVIQPNESIVFETGLKVAIPNGWGLFILPRSSTGFKLSCQLANTMGCIDSGYRDQVMVKLHNFGRTSISIEDGQRICQMFILPKFPIQLSYVEDDEDFRNGDRGGGIGSTGK